MPLISISFIQKAEPARLRRLLKAGNDFSGSLVSFAGPQYIFFMRSVSVRSDSSTGLCILSSASCFAAARISSEIRYYVSTEDTSHLAILILLDLFVESLPENS